MHRSRACKFCAAQDPSVLFLVETWADEAMLKKLHDDLQFDELWVVECVTRASGISYNQEQTEKAPWTLFLQKFFK